MHNAHSEDEEMYRDDETTGWHSDYGKRCLSVSAGMDMLGTRCGGFVSHQRERDDAITDMSYFPFYRYAMTFEEFVPHFLPVCR